jgi:hypothetical protein
MTESIAAKKRTDELIEKVVFSESVDSAKWKAVKGIDFPGSDNTVYQTEFKEVKIDLTPYRGQSVKLEFNVFDRGDTIYDTVALIDNVRINFDA